VYSVTAAATWPDGKLDVGGAWSRCGTAGRPRSVTRVVSRKIETSETRATATNTASGQRRVRSLITTKATALSAIADGVLATLEKNPETLFRTWSRCSAR